MNSLGPLLGLAAAVILIVKKIPPFWGLLIGAVLGGLLGGGSVMETAAAMLSGSVGMLSAVVCILASGVLAGALVKTGSAEKIAVTVIHVLGERRSLAAIACSVLLLTASGVFVDIAIITAAPIALSVGRKAGYSKTGILLAMVGGGKAGNIISPNPNTLAAAKAFDLELTSLMAVNLLPALCALTVTVLLVSRMEKSSREGETPENVSGLPTLWAALMGPLTVLVLLALRPLAGITVDPAAALPIGGLACMAACSAGKQWRELLRFGLGEVFSVALVLLGTGAVSGVIQASGLKTDMVHILEWLPLPAFVMAPLSGILMGGAAASTTAGTAIAGETFGGALCSAGVPALSAAAMIHAGATVLDSLPHGSFFHATAGCTGLNLEERMKLLPWEALIGLVSTAAAAALYMIGW